MREQATSPATTDPLPEGTEPWRRTAGESAEVNYPQIWERREHARLLELKARRDLRRANRDRKAAPRGSEEELAASALAKEIRPWIRLLAQQAAQAQRRLDGCRARRRTVSRERARDLRQAFHPERPVSVRLRATPGPARCTAPRRTPAARPAARRPRVRTSRSTRGSPSGSDDSGGEPPRPEPRRTGKFRHLSLAPPPKAPLTFGCIDAQSRGAEVEVVA